MRTDRSRWFGIWAFSLLLIACIFLFHAWLPTDGAVGDLESFSEEGFRIQWVIEKREAGLQAGDIILRAEGQTVEDWLNGAPRGTAWDKGKSVTYQIQRNGQTLTLPVLLKPVSVTAGFRRWALQLVVVFIMWLLAGFVSWRRPGERSAQLFTLCCIAATVHAWRDTYNFPYALLPGVWLFWIQYLLEQATYILAWSFVCHFFLVFPHSHPWLERYPRRVLFMVYGAPWLVMFASMVFYPTWGQAIEASNRAVVAVSMVEMAVALVAIFRSAFAARSPVARAQARWLALAALGPVILIGVGYFLPMATGHAPSLAHPVIVMTLLFIPMVIGIAALRYRLWDFAFVINRSLVYGVLTAIILALYLAVVTVLQFAFRKLTGQNSDWAIVGASLLIALMFQPLRRQVQGAIDRRFYRGKTDFRQALQTFAWEMRHCIDLPELLHLIVRRLSDLFHSTHGGVYLYQPEKNAFQLVESYNLPQAESSLRVTMGHMKRLRSGEAIAQPEDGVSAVLVPLMAFQAGRHELIGMLTLGPRRSGIGYGYEDLVLLMTLVDEAGTAISLAQAVADKQRVMKERELVEAASRDTEAKFLKIFYFSPVPMTICRASDECYVDVNESFLRVLGYGREEVIGRTALEIGLWANPLQSPEIDPAIDTPLSPHHYETEFRTKSGEIGTAWLFREFVELGNGKHFVDTLLDISERKRIEEELHASREAEKEFSEHLTALSEITTELSKEEKLEALCRRVIEMGQERLGYDRLSLWFVTEDRNSIKGMFGVDVQGRITDERQSTIQLNSASLIWPVLRGQIPIQLNANARLFAGGQVVGQGMRVTAGLWDGETVIGFLSVDNLLQKRPFTDHDCEILHLYASAVGHLCSLKKAQEALTRLKEELERHVTERTAQLEFANKELDAFNYSISHDLRTPLRSLDGFSRLLQEDYRDQLDAEGLIYLERIRGASQRMAGLIDDLLRLSRLTRSEMRIVQVDLSATAQSIADDLRATNPERQVEFSIMPGLMGNVDPNLLRIVLENLLGNAWKFTERHPIAHIEFAASQEGGQTVYRVRDDGAGFDMAYVEKLFGVFQRLHSIGEFEGTGIGLTIVQRIIHRHGGHVWVEAAVEQGATFYFTLGDSG